MTEGVVYLLNPAFIKVIGHLFGFVELEWIFVDNECTRSVFAKKLTYKDNSDMIIYIERDYIRCKWN